MANGYSSQANSKFTAKDHLELCVREVPSHPRLQGEVSVLSGGAGGTVLAA